MAAFRATAVATGLVTLLLFSVPLQLIILVVCPRWRFWLPNLVFGAATKIIGLRLDVHGARPSQGPGLIVANHISWIDIIAIGSLVPCHFIAKSDVARWPVFGQLAKLTGVLFLDRERRTVTAPFRSLMENNFAQGVTLVLFPEGTSTDGGNVLPFKSALFPNPGQDNVELYPLVISYYRNSPRDHTFYGWFADMTLLTHIWQIFKSGDFTIRLDFLPQESPGAYASRKDLAMSCEQLIREKLAMVRKEAKELSQISNNQKNP